MQTKRTWMAVACALVMALALAACGDDDSGGSSASSSTSTTSSSTSTTSSSTSTSSGETPKGDPIVIGMICSCTGVFAATNGHSDATLQSWADSVNATGGLNGHPVKLVIKQDGADPAKGLRDAKELVENDKVIAIVGDSSISTAAWAPYIDSKGVPAVGGNPMSGPMVSDPNFFPSAGGVPQVFGALVNDMHTAGAKKVGFMYCAEAPPCKQAVGVIQAFAQPLGMSVESVAVSAAATDYAAPCLKFKDAGVDAFSPGLDAQTAARAQAACIQQGFKVPLYHVGSGFSPIMLTDPSFEGATLVASNANQFDTSIPGVKRYQDDVKKYAGIDVSTLGYQPFTAFVGGLLFEAAAKAGNLGPDSTPDDVKKALYAIKDDTLEGTAPPLHYVKGEPTGNPCVFTNTIKGGKLEPENGGKPQCLPPETAAIAKSMSKSS